MIDLHTHTKHSDGSSSTEELLKEAKNITQILEEFEKGKIDGDRLFEILRELLDKSEENNKVQDDIKNLLRVICTQLENQGNDINEILTELQDKGAVLKDILVALKENGKTLDDIYNALLNQGKTQEQIVTLLLAIGEDVTNIKDMLYNMGKSNDEILDLLKGIYGNTTQILGTNQEILDKINASVTSIAGVPSKIITSKISFNFSII